MPTSHAFAAIRDRVRLLLNDLVFQEQAGRLELEGQRMLLLPAHAFGQLRLELIRSLGADLAQGLLKRYGYQAGFHDGHWLGRRHPGLTVEEQMHLGTLLHERQGVARVETLAESTEIDGERGVLNLQARWHDSIEAEQHLVLLGPSQEPVCWSLTGYASGHLSYLFQREAIAVETACRAQGHPHCTFEAGFREALERRYPGCGDDYRQIDLPALFHQLEATVREQRQTISRLQQQLQFTVQPETAAFGRLLGHSPALREAIAIAQAVAHVDSTVLITGESGTGKELIARGIHETSPRSGSPFVAINCATLPESLQSSELFGHARGAFTGAVRDKPGLFEATGGGTLFLDEVAELAPSAQAALLRVLQEGVVTRLGEHRERRVSARIIAATHRDLDAAIQTGAFRTDLFFRLNVINIPMPALRERDNDVLLLARQFIKEYDRKMNKSVTGLSPEVSRLFVEYDWPGNVRELRNVIERAVLLSRDDRIGIADLPRCLVQRASIHDEDTPRPREDPSSQHLRKTEIIDALTKSGGKRDRAAALLGMSRTTLWRKMKELSLIADRQEVRF
ncbi:MAG: sigma 54-interacting transcriptional regulator [Chromatiaceae bacterium]|nr:sigma 54-interacting transcriptional regulator [Candidatus Thioaporhodococcus sediminis]